MLGVDIAGIVDNEGVNVSSFKNGIVDMLTPLTNGNISPPPGTDTLNIPIELPNCPDCGANE